MSCPVVVLVHPTLSPKEVRSSTQGFVGVRTNGLYTRHPEVHVRTPGRPSGPVYVEGPVGRGVTPTPSRVLRRGNCSEVPSVLLGPCPGDSSCDSTPGRNGDEPRDDVGGRRGYP